MMRQNLLMVFLIIFQTALGSECKDFLEKSGLLGITKYDQWKSSEENLHLLTDNLETAAICSFLTTDNVQYKVHLSYPIHDGYSATLSNPSGNVWNEFILKDDVEHVFRIEKLYHEKEAERAWEILAKRFAEKIMWHY
jgi:hypothetical protein